jgi:hypothetical protein
MKKAELTITEIAIIGCTRAMIGAGAALLIADTLDVKKEGSLDGKCFFRGCKHSHFSNRRIQQTALENVNVLSPCQLVLVRKI